MEALGGLLQGLDVLEDELLGVDVEGRPVLRDELGGLCEVQEGALHGGQ